MIPIPWSIALSLAGALVGGAVAWGAMHATVKQLKELLVKVEAKVDGLTRLELKLNTVETILEQGKERVVALEHWRATFPTGSHKVVT